MPAAEVHVIQTLNPNPMFYQVRMKTTVQIFFLIRIVSINYIPA